MSPETLLKPFLANWPTFAALFLILIAVRILASPKFKGWFGEWIVNRGLSKLDPTRYRHFRDLYVPHPGGTGTTQVDHVVASTAGIFVIETKNFRGWIFGTEKQREWTQQIFRKKSRFQNPIHQNKLHVSALSHYLGLPEEIFRPVVIFIGNAEFKTAMPDNVLNSGLIPWIKTHPDGILATESFQNAADSLDSLDKATNRRDAARNHLKALDMRHATGNPRRTRN